MRQLTEIEYLKEQVRDYSLNDEDTERVCELLDAARPQRAPVDGICFCEETPWEYHTPGAPVNMLGCWSRMEAEYGSPTLDMTVHYHFGTYCADCGAALREGYAERGGDVARAEGIVLERGDAISIASTLHYWERHAAPEGMYTALKQWAEYLDALIANDAASHAVTSSDEKGGEGP